MDPMEEEDLFLRDYQPSELKTVSVFLTTWLPFLSRDLCQDCVHVLSNRIRSLDPGEDKKGSDSMETEVIDNSKDDGLKAGGDIVFGSLTDTIKSALPSQSRTSSETAPMSWADIQEDEFEEEEEEEEQKESDPDVSPSMKTPENKPKLPREQREYLRFMHVKRIKGFTCFEKVKGKSVNILEGIELHTGVFSVVEQKKVVDYVYELKEKGLKGELQERTFTAPNKWMRGKGRVTIQFGCCYNYSTDKAGNPPGILQRGAVDPLPSFFKMMIKRLIEWQLLPPTCVPDSCIVNIYEEDDCIPPHIDNHDFLRPFCTISFLSECNILFGSNLKVLAPGEFFGSYSLPLPVGSVLILNGNGADIAKHCIPAVPTKRISITFRKMDESKQPIGFTPEPDLQGIKPFSYEPPAPITPPPATPISSLNSSNGSNYNNRTAHREGSRGYHNSSPGEWSSSSQRRGRSRPAPTRGFRPKVSSNNHTKSDNV